MPHGFADRSAQQYSRYTGVSHQAALVTVRSMKPGAPRIAEAAGAQRRLEALVFEHLNGDIDYFTHPVGIESVTSRADSSVVTLDSSHSRNGHPLVAHALEGLLPADIPDQEKADCEDSVLGVPGIRVAGASRRAVHLTLAGTSARVALSSAGGEDWRQLVAERRRDLVTAGYRPCWDDRELSPGEVAFRRDHAWICQAAEEASWLPSGLLRRVALLHTVSAAYCTRYWVNSDDWIFQLRHDQGVRPPHADVVKHLLDRRWGLPMQAGKLHCECDASWADPYYDRSCTVRLSSNDGRPGTVQLRFQAMGTWQSSSDIHGYLTEAGADEKWLKRVMPHQG